MSGFTGLNIMQMLLLELKSLA